MSEPPASAAVRAAEAALAAGRWVALERDAVVVQGPDAEAFLGGQLSQDVVGLAVGGSAPSLLLEPGGTLGVWVRLHRTAPDHFVIDSDPGTADRLVRRLERFLLRTRAVVEPAADWQVRVSFTPGGVSGGRDVPQPELEVATTGALGWPGPGGVFVGGWAPPSAAAGGAGGATPGDEGPALQAALLARRVASGVPGAAELTEGRIPAEFGQWFIDASVSFTKGCYTGQELVARLDSRGSNVARRLVVVRLAEVSAKTPVDLVGPVAVGAALTQGGQELGTLTSLAWSPVHGWIGLAFVARRAVLEDAVAVRAGRATARATISLAPLDTPGP